MFFRRREVRSPNHSSTSSNAADSKDAAEEVEEVEEAVEVVQKRAGLKERLPAKIISSAQTKQRQNRWMNCEQWQETKTILLQAYLI